MSILDVMFKVMYSVVWWFWFNVVVVIVIKFGFGVVCVVIVSIRVVVKVLRKYKCVVLKLVCCIYYGFVEVFGFFIISVIDWLVYGFLGRNFISCWCVDGYVVFFCGCIGIGFDLCYLVLDIIFGFYCC